MNQLQSLKDRIKSNIQVKVQSTEPWQNEPWECCLFTERNEWPCWIVMRAATPDEAMERMHGYLDGRIPDHANSQRPPKAFLKEVQYEPQIIGS
jgi:hypothetical protein